MDFVASVTNFVRELWQLLRWWDVVDILAVSFICYQILVWIRGTRALQIMVGLFILFMIFLLSAWLEFRALRTLLGTIFGNLFIILIILFHQDIRRALSKVGANPFLSNLSGSRSAQVIEELVKSAVSLANRKIGALIVIEKQADVLDFVEAGTLIDGNLDRDLLSSVFMPVSPLHDGAVVIRKGRLHMAGCFLPLTLNPSVSRNVGTRHRAAVGLTEETDAICIVVSEETGTLSMAFNGKISHDLDGNQLRKLLLEAMSS